MKNVILSLITCLLLYCCKEEKSQANQKEIESTQVSDYQLASYNFEEFEAFLNIKDSSNTYIVNFWATWCAPCIKELPYFEKINNDYKDNNVEVLLVSLDFPKQYEKKLIPFIKEKQLQSKVIALNDTKMNDWIPKVNEDWSGAIPATIIYNSEKSKFYERSFTYEELEKELQTFLIP